MEWDGYIRSENYREKCYSACAINESYYLVGKWARDPHSAAVAKLSADGDSLWTRYYGGNASIFNCSTQSTDSNLVVGGDSGELAENGSYDAYLVKLDGDGEIIWEHVYGGEYGESFNDVVPTNDGGFLCGGSSSSFGNSRQYYIVRTDSEGEELWSGSYGTESYEVGTAITETSDGGCAIAGYIPNPGGKEPQGGMALTRIDPEGEEMRTQVYGGNEYERCFDVITLADDGFLIVGTTNNFGVFHAGYLVRTDSDGEELWMSTFYIGDDGD